MGQENFRRFDGIDYDKLLAMRKHMLEEEASNASTEDRALRSALELERALGRLSLREGALILASENDKEAYVIGAAGNLDGPQSYNMLVLEGTRNASFVTERRLGELRVITFTDRDISENEFRFTQSWERPWQLGVSTGRQVSKSELRAAEQRMISLAETINVKRDIVTEKVERVAREAVGLLLTHDKLHQARGEQKKADDLSFEMPLLGATRGLRIHIHRIGGGACIVSAELSRDDETTLTISVAATYYAEEVSETPTVYSAYVNGFGLDTAVGHHEALLEPLTQALQGQKETWRREGKTLGGRIRNLAHRALYFFSVFRK